MNEQEAKKYWEEFLKEIESLKQEKYPIDWEEQEEATKIAIKALEKQIPKKPVICDGFMTVARCPVCNDVLSFLSKYCKDCGNKIDWTVEE